MRYELCVAGDGYSLSAGGTEILSGKLRDYYGADRCSCCAPPVPCPYRWPSHLFLGDDTTSAEVILDLALVEVTTAGASLPVIGNTLTLTRSGGDLRLQVVPAAPASEYHLYRDTAPADIPGVSFARSATPVFPPDAQSLAVRDDFYYSVRGVGACGQEFP